MVFASNGPGGVPSRAGEAPSEGLTEALVGLGFETERLKTGTPSRVDARTIHYSALEEQPGDPHVRWFSFDPEVVPPPPTHVQAYEHASRSDLQQDLRLLFSRARGFAQVLET